MDHWVIDRFEEDFAVITYACNTAYIKASSLPEGAHEGSVFDFTAEGIILLPEEEKRILEENTNRLNRLFEKGRKSE